MSRGARGGLFLLALALAWIAGSAAPAVAQPRGGAATPFRRVIVLGFDGADPKLVRDYLAAGELPGFRALAARGEFRDLETSTPAQSPVSWASMITGMNPGKTGIFGFVQLADTTGASAAAGVAPRLDYTLTRWEDAPLPGLRERIGMFLGAGCVLGLLIWVLLRLVRVRGRIAVLAGAVLGVGLAGAAAYFLILMVPEGIRQTAPCRTGEPFYKILAEHGIASVALQAPMDAPPPSAPGLRVLCGLGLPDISGGDASWAVYTTQILDVERTPTGGRVVLLESLDGLNRVQIRGPENPFVRARLKQVLGQPAADFESDRIRARTLARLREQLVTRVPLEIRWKPGECRVELTLPELAPVELQVGAWTELLPIAFRAGTLVRSRGLVRFFLTRADDELVLYQEPIGWDPRHPSPLVPLSSPRGYAAALASEASVGPFETTGWGCATNALRDRMIPESAFIRDVMDGLRRREAMLNVELRRQDWRCLFAVFTGVDRLQHMLWRHLDPEHPAHDPAEAAEGRRALLEMYRAMDRIVARVRDYFDRSDTAILVLSDHGFASYRHGLNLNSWLRREGYLTVKSHADREATFARPFPNIDWTRTRAFAYGLGQIRINVVQEGGGGRGVVAPAERAALVGEIATKLRALRHDGRPVVERVDLRDEIYAGPHLGAAPDLVAGLVPGYRVSAATICGGVPAEVFALNEGLWSGDHCSTAASRAPGILLSNVKLEAESVGVADIAPTILGLFGVSRLASMDGRTLAAAPPAH